MKNLQDNIFDSDDDEPKEKEPPKKKPAFKAAAWNEVRCIGAYSTHNSSSFRSPKRLRVPEASGMMSQQRRVNGMMARILLTMMYVVVRCFFV